MKVNERGLHRTEKKNLIKSYFRLKQAKIEVSLEV